MEAGGQAIVGNVEAPAAAKSSSPAKQAALPDHSGEALNLSDLTGTVGSRHKERVKRDDP